MRSLYIQIVDGAEAFDHAKYAAELEHALKTELARRGIVVRSRIGWMGRRNSDIEARIYMFRNAMNREIAAMRPDGVLSVGSAKWEGSGAKFSVRVMDEVSKPKDPAFPPLRPFIVPGSGPQVWGAQVFCHGIGVSMKGLMDTCAARIAERLEQDRLISRVQHPTKYGQH